jgi:adenosylmethionine-8-amino-7-oxononanoate aminotransferase
MIERNLRHIWHPCSQMKDYEIFKPLEIVGAKGSHFELRDGRKIIDAISSWWCKSLGHQHPRLKKALLEQLDKFEHVILANTTNETIVAFSEKLTQLCPSLNKVFYASDGSCAIEIAMKMSLHARKILGDNKRQLFVSLENGYHGETLGAMSVSDIGLYKHPYSSMLFKTHHLSRVPYVNSIEDPTWNNCEDNWAHIEKQLAAYSDTATAVVVEPILQGAGGMKLYSQDFLGRLRQWTEKHDVHLIADEIMTGIGRTGKMLACEHAAIEPDFICLSKGLTSGWLPLSAVLTRQSIFDIFYDDYASGKSFLHSHTFSGNVLAASVGLAVLTIMEEEKMIKRAQEIGSVMLNHMLDIADSTKKLTNVRGIGAVVAADLIDNDSHPRLGFEIFQEAVKLGAYLRPLGNTLYWLPPLTIDDEDLFRLKQVTEMAIRKKL